MANFTNHLGEIILCNDNKKTEITQLEYVIWKIKLTWTTRSWLWNPFWAGECNLFSDKWALTTLGDVTDRSSRNDYVWLQLRQFENAAWLRCQWCCSINGFNVGKGSFVINVFLKLFDFRFLCRCFKIISFNWSFTRYHSFNMIHSFIIWFNIIQYNLFIASFIQWGYHSFDRWVCRWSELCEL